MLEITPQDQLLVADCVHTPGFEVLMKLLDAHRETLENCIEGARTDAEEHRYVTEWKSYRSVIANLKEISELVKEEPRPELLDPFDEDRKDYVKKMVTLFGNMDLGENTEYAE